NLDPSRLSGKRSSQARYSSCTAISAVTAAAQRLDRGGRCRAGAGGRGAALLAQPGAASRLPLGSGQREGVEARSGNGDLRLSIVTVTFPGWLGQPNRFVVVSGFQFFVRSGKGRSSSRRLRSASRSARKG